MKATTDEVYAAIKSKNYQFFIEAGDIYDNVEQVYSQNWGDGNAINQTYHFKDLDMYVSIEGWYSSWNENSWHTVYIAEPYEYSEIRYRQAV